MLGTFAKAFRTPDLRRKLLFTIGIMVLFRLGSFIPTPGVDYAAINSIQKQASGNDLLGLINLFSGGGLLQLSVFALGIMPYITASIIVQLLRVVIPRFEALHKEGQSGQTKLTQYTRYLTIALAILQSTAVITTARSGALFGQTGTDTKIIDPDTPWTVALMIITMTAGTGLIMWLGELITEKGVGNGMSLLIFTSIVAGFPGSMGQILGSSSGGVTNFIVVLVVFVGVIGAIVFVEQSQRRIRVQYAKRMVGRRTYGGSTTYIPIKINTAGVIPIIFSSSLLTMPSMITQFVSDQSNPVVQWIQMNLGQTDALYMILYAALTIFFCFFYTAITFNPEEVADNMKKYGGFIPGIRAGRPTAEYLAYVINRITTPGSIYLAMVALIPQVLFGFMGINQNLPFGGTTLLIIVGVGLDTVKQIESQLQQRHYEGFLR
ncbi:MAG: preprotein translocase subunit SecY [Bifidobacteriaceae bacterium]|nr:preprotein translocase subunit SecY [Bifidobacteriaceae bacterium]